MQCALRCQLQRPRLPSSPAVAGVSSHGKTLNYQQQCRKFNLDSLRPNLTASQSGTKQQSITSECLYRERRSVPPSLASKRARLFFIGRNDINGISGVKSSTPNTKLMSSTGLHINPRCVTDTPLTCRIDQNGNSSKRSFNFWNPILTERALPRSSPRPHLQTQLRPYRQTPLSRYHSSSSNSNSNNSSGSGNGAVTGVDSLQTWRRPFTSRPSSSGLESRSLATMPTAPARKGAQGTAPDPVARLQRSLAAVPHHNIKNEIKLRCTEFDHKGNVKTTAGEFLKSDLCQQHGLHARDLRKIDSSFNNQMPVLLVRPEAILVNVGHIRALIKADLVVLFDSFGSTDSYNQSIFIYDLEEKLRMSTSAAGGLPFEFRALEAIFISVLSSLQSEMEVLVHFVTNLLAQLEESIDQNKLKELLQYSKKLSQFESKTLLIRDVFVEVLDQDDDLANMYLTEKKLGNPRTIDSHEEIEILLESYLKQVEEIANTVSIVKQQMQSTEEIVNVILGANRNQLLLFELRIAMGTLGMSSGAIIASLYGMNLHNYLETNPHAFAIVGTTALGISMTVFAFCSRKLKMLAKGTT
ncbi:magnesium ion transporter [Mortierella sp. AM989]|nr:magnesium ion transporter [Mortierella sp. AM989]